MKIAIVNDTAMSREVLQRIVRDMGEHQIAWVAHDGAEAVQRCVTVTPDLILMDLFMPVMDGVEATRRIMAATPCAILIVTATVNGHSAKVYDALGAGALDAVTTPSLSPQTTALGTAPLLAKIAMVQSLLELASPSRLPPHARVTAATDTTPPPAIHPAQSLVAIGASAGGPSALATILRGLTPRLTSAIVIVQHLDAQFTEDMARWLNEQSAVPVRVAQEGDHPTPGVALIAGTDDHLVFTSATVLGYVREPRDTPYRPSVDVFFRSIVTQWRGRTVGVLLTGMGRDGAMGLRQLRDNGAVTIAQDRASSAVYGMPKAAADLDAAAEILALTEIAPRLTILSHEIVRLHERKSPCTSQKKT